MQSLSPSEFYLSKGKPAAHCKSCHNDNVKKWQARNGDKYKEYNRRSHKKAIDRRRQMILDAYGRECVCCGETIEIFLTVDHINDDGAEHRKLIGRSNLYKWLITNDYPPQFQILCLNCNWAKSRGGCPHQT